MHEEMSEPCHQHETLDGDKLLSVLDLGWTRSTRAISQNSTLDNDKLLGVFDTVYTKKHLKHVTELEHWMVKNSWECLTGWMKKLFKHVSALRH